MRLLGLLPFLLPASAAVLLAQSQPANYDEAKIPAYTLPDPLGGVKSKAEWPKRRTQLLEQFGGEMFGPVPARLSTTVFETTSVDRQALGGKATRKLITALFNGKKDGPRMEILLYLPNSVKGRAPVFLGLNFQGNHAVAQDSAVPLGVMWPRAPAPNAAGKQANEASRGSNAEAWQVDLILSRGFGLATINYQDIDPDFDDGFQNGVHPLFPWSPLHTSMAAWAWGLSRAMDYLETDRQVDSKRVALIGHSRLGKAAVWAGANDQRFALVISNNSGAGGAALSKRVYGEDVAALTSRFPHWFVKGFAQYANNEAALPFDQHMLLALIAPRPLYVASALEDQWADPKGEFLGALGASPVYKLLGTPGLAAAEMPAVHQPVRSIIGYHIREGKHAVTRYDWEQYLDFAARHLGVSR
jgi:hypothetical protein